MTTEQSTLHQGFRTNVLNFVGHTSVKSLVKDCNRAQFYAFLADEATDASTMEQISICVRFVHRKDEDNTVEVREEFLGFVEAESTKGVALAEKFMTTQAEFGIETRKMPCARLRRCGKYGRSTQGCASNHKTACTRSSVRPLQSTLS